MVLRICEYCNFTTRYKNVYDNHIKSKRHTEHINNIMTNNNCFTCKKCSKIYKSNSGLWRHSRTCTSNVAISTSNTSILESRITELENELNELKNSNINSLANELSDNTSNGIINTSASITNNTTNTNSNNTTNTTNNIYINYLNTNCPDAMSIKEFVEKLVFTKDDIKQLLTDHYDKVVTKLLIERLEDIPKDQRPLYCIAPTSETQGSFAVKTTNWKEETQPNLETHIRDIEDDDEYAKMTMPTSIDEINNKVYDKYEDARKIEPDLEQIRKKMFVSNRTEEKIKLLNNLLKADSLQIPLDS